MGRFNLFLCLCIAAFLAYPVFAEEKGTAEKKEGAKVIQYHMPPLITSYIDPYYEQPTHNVVVLYTLELKDKQTKKEIKLWQDRLHDAILRSFNNYLQVIWEGKGELSIEHVGLFIKKVVTQLIEKDRLTKVQIHGLRIDRTVKYK